VSRPAVSELISGELAEASEVVARRVARVRWLSQGRGVRSNAEIPAETLDRLAPLSGRARDQLERALRAGALSARGLQRVRRVARTLADLAGEEGVIDASHVAAALELRVGSAVLSPRLSA
jgi:magnesium chelatase family protein